MPRRWLTKDEMATWRALDALLSRLPTELGHRLEQDADLSYTEYYVLAGLSDQPDHRIRLTRLAELAHCELSRLSHMISRLERRGLVRREPDPTDGRFTLAVLTDAGYEHLVATAPAHVAAVRQLVFDSLSTDEQHALRDAAATVLARLDDQGS